MIGLILAAAVGYPALSIDPASYGHVADPVLTAVNREVNRVIVRQSDMAQYGRADVWRVEPASARGDCEDYALTKLVRLARMGEPMGGMSIIGVRLRTGEMHAVLSVRGRVLDSLSPWISPRGEYTVVFEIPARAALDRAGHVEAFR